MNGHQVVWITGAGLIAAYFGKDGLLRHIPPAGTGEPFVGWVTPTCYTHPTLT